MFSRLARISRVGSHSSWNNVALMNTQYRTLYTVNVGDLMKQMNQAKILSISQEERIKIAAQTMESEKIGALVVSDNNGDNEMVGILTARDVQQAVAENEEADLVSVHVKDVMTPKSKVKTAKLSDNLEDVATQMIENNIRHIPVMDKEGRNCGMLSIKDVVRVVLADEREEIKEYQRIVSDSYSA